jgi:hypothetical protein
LPFGATTRDWALDRTNVRRRGTAEKRAKVKMQAR